MELFLWFQVRHVHKKHLQNCVQSACPFTKQILAWVAWDQVNIISSSQSQLGNLDKEQFRLQKNLCSYFKFMLETHPENHVLH